MRPAQESVPAGLCAGVSRVKSFRAAERERRGGGEGRGGEKKKEKGALLSRRRLGVFRIVPLRRRRREVWCSPTRPSPAFSSSFSSSPTPGSNAAPGPGRQRASRNLPTGGRGREAGPRERRQESQLGGGPPRLGRQRRGKGGGSNSRALRTESPAGLSTMRRGAARGRDRGLAWRG